MKKNIVTIWWWNWHSNLLEAIYFSFLDKINLKSIVSMSDDGRTTWKLMDLFDRDLALYLPPPWDLRRCLYSLSGSIYRDNFKKYFEEEIVLDFIIKNLSLRDIFLLSWVSKEFIKHLEKFDSDFLNFKLPINSGLLWHKLGNILMSFLYYNFWNYKKMLFFMQELLESKWEIIPITTDKAFLEAVLENGEIIKNQDNISNGVSYSSKIKKLRLMKWSENAKNNYNTDSSIENADYIIIWPWDLYTSIICNLIIWNIKKTILKSSAKIIFISNNTNKWWETKNYGVLDFVYELEKYLWKNIDFLIVNNNRLNLSVSEKKRLRDDISVKGGEYIFLEDKDKKILTNRWTEIFEGDLIDKDTLYKHNKENIWEILEQVIRF